jgi:hypothetical protein
VAWGHDGALLPWSNPGARDHHLESGLDLNEAGRMAKQSRRFSPMMGVAAGVGTTAYGGSFCGRKLNSWTNNSRWLPVFILENHFECLKHDKSTLNQMNFFKEIYLSF